MLYITAEKKIVKIKITLIFVVMSELKLKNWKDLDFGNPISGNIFCADPTAVEFEGRLYVYGTNDHEQYLNAEKNLLYFATVKGIPRRERKAEIKRVLEIVGLKGVKKPVKSFSLGMQQRLGIANAILGNPDILILDEPTNGLDPQGIADIRNLIKKLRDENNMTVIVSSHILGELEHTADRFGIVNEGIVVKEITQMDLQENQPAVEIAVDDLVRAKEVLENAGIKIIREVNEKSSLEDFYFRLVGGSAE